MTIDEVVRGSVVRKRKYPRQISLAVRSITTGLHLVMIDRSNPDLALPLEGCFVGSLVEVRLEAVNRGGTTGKLSTEADHNHNHNNINDNNVNDNDNSNDIINNNDNSNDIINNNDNSNDIINDNDNDNNNDDKTTQTNNKNKNKNQHRSAKGLTLLRSSPDPNAIQTCLKLVAENKLPLAVFSWGGDRSDRNDGGTATGDSVAGNNFNDESNNTESETNQRWLLLRDTEHALSILEKNPKDAFRRAAVKHLSSGLGGEGRWEDYCLVGVGVAVGVGVGVGVDNSGGEAAAVVGSLSGSVPALQPRRRPSHIKRRHRTTLERLEVSQAPLAAIERDGDGDSHGEDSGSVAVAVAAAAVATAPQHDGNSNVDDVVVESKAASATRLTMPMPMPMPMPLSAAYNLPDPHDPRSMSGRHPKTRREYLRDKKWPQLDWLVKRLGPILETLRKKHEGSEPRRRRRRRRRIEILDVGGGRGDIAVAVAEAFDDVRVTVVDVNESSLVGGRAYYESRKQWWTNTSGKIHGASQNNENEDEHEDDDDRVVFVCDDFADYAKSVERFDVVLAWHACGDLSDLALECSLERSGAFVICPCCYTKRHVRGFTPSWIGNYCRVVPSSLSTLTSSTSALTSSSSAIAVAVAVAASPADPAAGSDPAEEKKEEPPETATPDGTCTIAAIPQTMPKKAPPIKTLPKPPSDEQQQQQQQQRAQEIATIQRLAEINERPEITHRAMKLINTMRMRSLLALSSKTHESTAGGESASTNASTNASTSASATDGDCPNKDAILVENSRFSITLEEYDIAYSSKNLVLVGVRK